MDEQNATNVKVGGSNPLGGTNIKKVKNIFGFEKQFIYLQHKNLINNETDKTTTYKTDLS